MTRKGATVEPAELTTVAGAPDKPLIIGDVEIGCYVLENETRVLSQRGLTQALATSRGGSRGGDPKAPSAVSLPRFAESQWLRPFLSTEVRGALQEPIRFRTPSGALAFGYPAEILPAICDAIIQAREAGATSPQQEAMIGRALTIIRALATVGIIALIDEATGYQEIRQRRALANILEEFIAKELRPWTRTFPYEFYVQIYRLKQWPGPDGVKRTQAIGHITNDIVYERIAPGVLAELRERNPVLPSGRRRVKHHQWFTEEIGHPKLKEHLAAVIALMRAAGSWPDFMMSLDRAYPKHNKMIPMALRIS